MNPIKSLFPSSRLTLVTRISPQQTAERRARFTPEMKHRYKEMVFDVLARQNGRDLDQLRDLIKVCETHHLQPISLGGHPTDPKNIVVIAPRAHKLKHNLIGRQLDFARTGYVWIPYPDPNTLVVVRPDCFIKSASPVCLSLS